MKQQLAAVTLAAAAVVTSAGFTATDRDQGRLLPIRQPITMTIGTGSVWIATSHDLLRIAPRSESVTARIPLPHTSHASLPSGMTVSGQTLWLVMTPIETTPNAKLRSELWSINTTTNTVDRSPITLPFATAPAVAAGDGSLWLANDDHARFGRVYQLRISTRTIVRALPIPDAPTSIVTDHGRLWIGEADSGAIVSVDPRTGKQVGRPIPTGGALLSLAADGPTLWVADSYKQRLLAVSIPSRTIARTRPLANISAVTVGNGAV